MQWPKKPIWMFMAEAVCSAGTEFTFPEWFNCINLSFAHWKKNIWSDSFTGLFMDLFIDSFSGFRWWQVFFVCLEWAIKSSTQFIRNNSHSCINLLICSCIHSLINSVVLGGDKCLLVICSLICLQVCLIALGGNKCFLSETMNH